MSARTCPAVPHKVYEARPYADRKRVSLRRMGTFPSQEEALLFALPLAEAARARRLERRYYIRAVGVALHPARIAERHWGRAD